MALLGKLTVPVIADTSRFSSGLASSARMADAWSGKVGGSVDKIGAGFDKAGKQTTGLVGLLGRVSKAARFGRDALDVGEIGRAAGWSAVGVGRLRLAFMGSGEKADALRARLDSTSGALRKMGAASEKMRWGLLSVGLGTFLTKMALVGGGPVIRAARSALGSIFLGGLRMTGGLIRAGAATVGFIRDAKDAARYTAHFALNLAKAGVAFGGYALSFGRWSKAGQVGVKSLWRAATSMYGAVLEGASAFSRIPSIAGGFASVVRGATGATKGVLRFGLAVTGVGWSATKGLALGLAKAIGKIAGSAINTALRLTKLGAVAGVVGAAFAVKAAAGAARFEEVLNKTKEVFGEHADSVIAESGRMAAAYGADQRAFLDSASNLGSMLQGVGYTGEDSAKLGTNLAKLAKDMEAFREIPFDQALQKIRSGLAGETEPLKSIGILVDDNAVKTYAWTHGIAANGEALTNSQKVQARLALITQGLAKDQGALARESTGTAAQLNEFWGRLSELGRTIGSSFAPALGGALETVNQAIFMLTDNWDSMAAVAGEFLSGAGSSLAGWAASVAEFFEIGTGSISSSTIALGVLTNAWQALRIGFKVVVTTITAGLSGILNGLGWIGDAIDFVYQKITGESTGIGEYLDRLGNKMATIAGESAQSVREEWAKPWASMTDAPEQLGKSLTGVADKVKGAFAAAGASIRKNREEMAKPLDFSASDPKGLEAPKKEKEAKERSPFAGAYELGSKDAANIIARHRFGGQNDPTKHAKTTADNTGKIARSIEKVNEVLRSSPRVGIVGLA